jgi:hypothetical protein
MEDGEEPPGTGKPVEFVRTGKNSKNSKKIDSMRIENRTTIVSQTKNIIEFSQLEFCKMPRLW